MDSINYIHIIRVTKTPDTHRNYSTCVIIALHINALILTASIDYIDEMHVEWMDNIYTNIFKKYI